MQFSNGLKKYFANTSWLFLEKSVRMVVSLFVAIFVARFLGPERFGLLSYAISFAGLFAILASLGLDGILVRDLIENEKQRDHVLGSAIVLRLMGAFAMAAVLLISVRFTSNDSYTNLIIFIIAGKAFFNSLNVIDFFFQSKVLSKYVVQVQILTSLAISLFQVLLIFMNASLAWFAIAITLEGFFLSFGLMFQYLKFGLSPKLWRFDLKVAGSLLSNSWPMILMGMFIAVYMKIDQVMLKEMLGDDAVGNYAAAVKLSEACYVIPVVICGSLFPSIIQAKEKNRKLYYDRLQRLYDIITALSLGIAVPVSLMANPIVSLLYGTQYQHAGNVLAIHIWAGVAVFWGVASQKWILAENLQRKAIILHIVGAGLNIILNLILIPKYGIKGAAWATLISYFFASYFISYIVREFRISWKMFNRSYLNLLRLKFLDIGGIK